MDKFQSSAFTYILLTSVMIWGLCSCDISDNKIENLDESFHRVYNNPDFDVSYAAVDIKQTADGGYVILQESPSSISGLMGSMLGVDKDGKFVSLTAFPEDINLTCKDLVLIDSSVFVIGNQANSAVILPFNDSSFSTPIAIQTGLIPSPVAAAVVDTDQILLLGAEIGGEVLNMPLVVVDTSGQVSGNKLVTFGLDETNEIFIERFQKEVEQHLDGSGRRLPFFVGQTLDGTYYFNGFNKSTLSLVFTNLTNTNDIWEVQGQQSQAPISALINTIGSNYALARNNTSDNYLIAQYALPISIGGTHINNVDIDSLAFPEIAEYATTKVKVIEANGKEVVVFGSTTREGRIVLIAYDPIDGTFLGSNYFGFSVPHEFGNFIQTADNGLAIVGTAYVSGRFKRTSFFKVSSSSLSEWIK